MTMEEQQGSGTQLIDGITQQAREEADRIVTEARTAADEKRRDTDSQTESIEREAKGKAAQQIDAVRRRNLSVDEWGSRLVTKWNKFQCLCEELIKDLTNPAYLLEEIEANRWNEPGAEQYNFLERADGATVCISEMKAQAIEAGFGPVVRA